MLDWPATFRVVTLLAIAANAFSGVAALVHFKPIIPAWPARACRNRG